MASLGKRLEHVVWVPQKQLVADGFQNGELLMRRTGGCWVPTGVRAEVDGSGIPKTRMDRSQRGQNVSLTYLGVSRGHTHVHKSRYVGGIVTRRPTNWITSDKIISPRLRGLATDSRSSDVLPSWCSVSEMTTTNSPPAAVTVGLGARL